MATITKLTKIPNPRKARGKTTEATYYFDDDGTLQVKSTGSNDKVFRGKQSQNLRFPPAILAELFAEWQEWQKQNNK